MAGNTVIVNIIGDASHLSRALTGAGQDLDSFSSRMQSVGSKMTSVGRNLTMGLTLPIVGLGVVAFNAAQDFETAFAGVTKTVDGTAKQIAGLRQGIIDMSKELPSTTTEIAAVAEAAGQLGIKTEDILTFTRVMLDLGNTTNLTAVEAATALAQLGNIIQLSGDQWDELGSTIVDLGNKGASTEADIVQMALRIAGAGKQVGLTAPQILSVGAALANVGLEAEAGGSAISRTLIEMATSVAVGGDALEGWAAIAGTSVGEFAELFERDAAGALVKFIAGLQRIDKEGGSVLLTLDELGIREIRQRDAILRLVGAGDMLTKTLDTGNQAWSENNALTDEAAKRYETNQAKMDIIKNKLTDVARVLGETLMPIVERVADWIARMAEKFQALDPEMQKIILVVAGLAAVLGPLLVVLGSFVTVLGVLLSTTGLVVLAILAIAAAAFLVWTKWDQIWNWIKDHPALAAIILILSGPVGAMVLIVGGLKTLWENWSEIWGWIKEAATDAADFIVDALRPITNFLDAIIAGVRAVKRAIESIPNIASDLGDAVPDVTPWKGLLPFAHGGFVPGVGNSDTVPALLTPGEFVVSKAMMRGGGGSSSGGATSVTLSIPWLPQLADLIVTEINRIARGGPVLISAAVG